MANRKLGRVSLLSTMSTWVSIRVFFVYLYFRNFVRFDYLLLHIVVLLSICTHSPTHIHTHPEPNMQHEKLARRHSGKSIGTSAPCIYYCLRFFGLFVLQTMGRRALRLCCACVRVFVLFSVSVSIFLSRARITNRTIDPHCSVHN